MAMDLVKASSKHHFIIFSDSLSSLVALHGHHQNHPYIIELREDYFRLVHMHKLVVLAWVPSHVGIPGNERADSLAKEALNTNVKDVNIPYTDWRSKINIYIRNRWQGMWDIFPENKLHALQPTVGLACRSPLTRRRDDLVLTRARIGHTYLTHAYLLRGEAMPRCVPCDCALTVKHILVYCVDYDHIRQRYYDVLDIKTLFQSVSSSLILNFLREANLFKQF